MMKVFYRDEAPLVFKSKFIPATTHRGDRVKVSLMRDAPNGEKSPSLTIPYNSGTRHHYPNHADAVRKLIGIMEADGWFKGATEATLTVGDRGGDGYIFFMTVEWK